MTSAREVRDRYERHWMLSTLPMAVLVGLFVAVQAQAFTTPQDAAVSAVWLQFLVYLLHEFEEHVWPGGFKDYVNQRAFGPKLRTRFGDRVPPGDFPLTDRSVFWINILVIWVAFPVFAMLANDQLAWGAMLPAIGMVNAALHVLFAIATRSYNPGLAVSVVLNIPTGIWTIALLQTAGVSSSAIVLSFVAAIVVHIALVAWALSHAMRSLLPAKEVVDG